MKQVNTKYSSFQIHRKRVSKLFIRTRCEHTVKDVLHRAVALDKLMLVMHSSEAAQFKQSDLQLLMNLIMF